MFDFGQKYTADHPNRNSVERVLYQQAPCSIFSIVEMVTLNALPFVKALERLELSTFEDAARAYLTTVGNGATASDIKIAVTTERKLIEQYVLDKKINYIYQLLCILFEHVARNSVFHLCPEFLLNYMDNTTLDLLERLQSTGNPNSVVDRIQTHLFDMREQLLNKRNSGGLCNEYIFWENSHQRITRFLTLCKSSLRDDGKRRALIRLLEVFLHSLEIKQTRPLETVVDVWRTTTQRMLAKDETHVSEETELGYLLDPTPFSTWVYSCEGGCNKNNKPLCDFQRMTVLLHLYSLKDFLLNGGMEKKARGWYN